MAEGTAKGMWAAITVKSDGEVYLRIESSPCYSEAEYNGREGASKTIWSGTVDYWDITDDPGYEHQYHDDCVSDYVAQSIALWHQNYDSGIGLG